MRDDSGATGQSVVALTLAGLSFGLGLTAAIGGDLFAVFLGGVIGIALGVVVGFVWLSVAYVVVTRLFKGATSYWSLARPVFFASSPAVVFLLMIIPVPGLSEVFRIVGLAWIATSNVFAIKNSMGFDNQRSFATFIIAAFVLLIAYGLLTSL